MHTDGRTDGHTDMKMLIVAFRNFAKARKNEMRLFPCVESTDLVAMETQRFFLTESSFCQ